MKPRTLSLTEQERAQLEQIRDRDPKPYRRERAAALLKVADGIPAVTVALKGLLTLSKDYLNQGIQRQSSSG